ncbi:hypothetical protein [Geobacter pickeringii]|uniref:DUF2019 domain-containing protein n=1 Tax=Geobacter pickeringii TaxID=345632 RepID=A0A0B5BL68_9BACT|nr:hypothetical protein [Geobacter pickeringii]AJE04801.1 hypothetical protein GPICK_03790 [Geobacter pickeringii]
MVDERLERLLHRFAAAASLHAAAVEAMDEEGARHHAAIVQRLYGEIVRCGAEGREELVLLAERGGGPVAGMAAVYSLRHAPERCVPVLRRLAGEPGLLGFRASVALDRWERGEWELE